MIKNKKTYIFLIGMSFFFYGAIIFTVPAPMPFPKMIIPPPPPAPAPAPVMTPSVMPAPSVSTPAGPKTSVTQVAADSDLVQVYYPKIEIHNQNKKKTASLTGITLNYQIPNTTKDSTLTSSTSIKIAPLKGIQFTPILKIKYPPVQSGAVGDEQQNIITKGVSEIQIGNDKISINPAWLATEKTPAICIDFINNKWALASSCKKAPHITKKTNAVQQGNKKSKKNKKAAKTIVSPQNKTT
ncbi:hypothetical protein HYV11_01200 [Candidatus Dependentiae bacterium]|nr:hypothetical protein [Candidatus Dependentiae bacterium]